MCGINYKDCEFCLENANVKDNLMRYKCLCCNGDYWLEDLLKTVAKEE